MCYTKNHRHQPITMEEDDAWGQMLASHDRVFAYTESEMGCTNPEIVPNMVIWMVPHMPWGMRLLCILEAWMADFMKLLKANIDAGMLERGYGPYANQWFCIKRRIVSFGSFRTSSQ